MTNNQLQLTLIPDPLSGAQPLLPPDVRAEGIEIIAMMLLRLVRAVPVSDGLPEVRDESR